MSQCNVIYDFCLPNKPRFFGFCSSMSSSVICRRRSSISSSPHATLKLDLASCLLEVFPQRVDILANLIELIVPGDPVRTRCMHCQQDRLWRTYSRSFHEQRSLISVNCRAGSRLQRAGSGSLAPLASIHMCGWGTSALVRTCSSVIAYLI
jgi:hypothetical protein